MLIFSCVRERLLLIQACRNLVSDNRSPYPKRTCLCSCVCVLLCVCVRALRACPHRLGCSVQRYILPKPRRCEAIRHNFNLTFETVSQRKLCKRSIHTNTAFVIMTFIQFLYLYATCLCNKYLYLLHDYLFFLIKGSWIPVVLKPLQK